MLQTIIQETDVISSKTVQEQRDWTAGINVSTPVQPGQMAYLVSVRVYSVSSAYHRCTGTLIDDRHVITGAKCITTDADFFIMAGAQSADELEVQSTATAKRKAVAAKVSSVRLFTSGSNERDIAILRLERTLPVTSPHIGYVQLPHRVHTGVSQFPSGESCVLSAWGRDPFRRRDILFWTNVTLIAGGSGTCRYPDTCVDVYPRADGHCRADPGSPIICNNVLAGVLGNYNGGTDCVHNGPATAFVRIEDRLDWIRQVVNEPDEPGNTLTRHRPYFGNSYRVSATSSLIGLLQCTLLMIKFCS